jgi:hypothetical protein
MIGGRTRARTWDPLIKSQLLYQLSYAPGLLYAGGPPSEVRLAKAGGGVQPRWTAVPVHNHKPRQRKNRRADPAASEAVAGATGKATPASLRRLLGPRAAVRAHGAAFAAARAAMHPAALAATATLAAHFMAAELGQNHQPVLLAVV